MPLNWPSWAERTSAEERSSTSPFQVGFRRTKRELRKEFEKMGAEWWLDDETGSGGDPGVVVHWEVEGEERAVCCDEYTSKADNLREVYLWIHETRMRSNRHVQHAGEQFAAAALPHGDEERAMVVGKQPAHEVLGVSPDAPEAVVRGAFRELTKEYHSDTGDEPDPEKVRRIREARDEMLGDEVEV